MFARGDEPTSVPSENNWSHATRPQTAFRHFRKQRQRVHRKGEVDLKGAWGPTVRNLSLTTDASVIRRGEYAVGYNWRQSGIPKRIAEYHAGVPHRRE